MKLSLLLLLSMSLFTVSCGRSKQAETSFDDSKIVLKDFHYYPYSKSSLSEETLNSLPDKVDLREAMTSVKNQGKRGTCTFFSSTALVEAAIKKDLGKDINISEEHLISMSPNLINYSEGSSSYMNIKRALPNGFMLEENFPYNPSFTTEKGLPCYEKKNPGARCFVRKLPKSLEDKVFGAGKIEVGFLVGTDDILKTLASGRPVAVAIPVHWDAGWRENKTITFNEKLNSECANKKEKCGGHEVVLTGFDKEKKIFFFKNSWGEEWGDKGYGTMDFSVVDNYIADDWGVSVTAFVSEAFEVEENKSVGAIETKDLSIYAGQREGQFQVVVNGVIENLKGRSLYLASKIRRNDKMIFEREQGFLPYDVTQIPTHYFTQVDVESEMMEFSLVMPWYSWKEKKAEGVSEELLLSEFGPDKIKVFELHNIIDGLKTIELPMRDQILFNQDQSLSPNLSLDVVNSLEETDKLIYAFELYEYTDRGKVLLNKLEIPISN